jgi:WD40 repeat protein
VVSRSLDGTVKVWDAETGKGLLTLQGHTESVDSVVFSPDGKRIVQVANAFLRPTSRSSPAIMVGDAENGKEILTLVGCGFTVPNMAWDLRHTVPLMMASPPSQWLCARTAILGRYGDT